VEGNATVHQEECLTKADLSQAYEFANKVMAQWGGYLDENENEIVSTWIRG